MGVINTGVRGVFSGLMEIRRSNPAEIPPEEGVERDEVPGEGR